MEHNIVIYIAVMASVTFLIRVLPLTLIRKQITNRFLRSFLYYVPYVTLSVMTFPAILHATESPWAALLALAVGAVAACFGLGLFRVSVACLLTVLLSELIFVPF